LLSTDSWELRPRIQYIRLSFAPNFNLFNQMCFCQVRRLSKCRPKYFAPSACGNWWSLNITGGHVSFSMVKVTWLDFVLLALIRQIFNQFWIKLQC
jgi:hypothetical protein